jgi:hypothetical protein
MSFYDFFQRMTGQQPPMSSQSNQPQAPFATMPQIQADDYRDAALGKMGQLGMLLVAAGQRMTPKERATILAQAPQYMDGVQRDAMTAAQARLMNISTKAKQDEIAQQQALGQQAPALAKQLGISPELSSALSPEQIRDMYIKRQMADPRDSKLMDLKLQEEQLKIDALRNPGRGTPQMVDLPGGGKGWATPGSTDVTPIGGAGKGGVDPATVKRSDNEDMNLTYAREAITANKFLSDPIYSGPLTSGWKNRVNKIPTLEGSWAGKEYLTGDSQSNSFVDSVVRPRSGAIVGDDEKADKKRIFTPMPGDTPQQLFEKAQMRAQHIQSLIAGANPADRPMLMKMFQDSEQELLNSYQGAPGNQQQSMPGVKSIRQIQ